MKLEGKTGYRFSRRETENGEGVGKLACFEGLVAPEGTRFVEMRPRLSSRFSRPGKSEDVRAEINISFLSRNGGTASWVVPRRVPCTPAK